MRPTAARLATLRRSIIGTLLRSVANQAAGGAVRWRSPAMTRTHLATVVALITAAGAARAADPGTDFFEAKVRPVLVERCYKCHSTAAKKQQGGLHLDTRDAIRAGGDS